MYLKKAKMQSKIARVNEPQKDYFINGFKIKNDEMIVFVIEF